MDKKARNSHGAHKGFTRTDWLSHLPALANETLDLQNAQIERLLKAWIMLPHQTVKLTFQKRYHFTTMVNPSLALQSYFFCSLVNFYWSTATQLVTSLCTVVHFRSPTLRTRPFEVTGSMSTCCSQTLNNSSTCPRVGFLIRSPCPCIIPINLENSLHRFRRLSVEKSFAQQSLNALMLLTVSGSIQRLNAALTWPEGSG